MEDTVSDKQMEFQKRTLEPGWAEVRIVMQRPGDDSPDFTVTGEDARLRWIKLVLSTASGIAHMLHDHETEIALVELWTHMEDAHHASRG